MKKDMHVQIADVLQTINIMNEKFNEVMEHLPYNPNQCLPTINLKGWALIIIVHTHCYQSHHGTIPAHLQTLSQTEATIKTVQSVQLTKALKAIMEHHQQSTLAIFLNQIPPAYHH